MADLAKEESAKEVENVIINSGIRFRSYSTLGLRDDAEFLFWFAAETVEEIQNVISKLYLTVFGKYIIPSRVYLSCTRSSTYARKGTLPSFVLGNEPCTRSSTYARKGTIPSFVLGNEPQKYVIVYPFTKTREWYLLPQEQRQKMMDQHINVSEKYPQVTLNTTYSFGIGDQDFMLAFECDDLRDFQNLIMDLRQTPVSAYVAVDTPMITCVKKDIVPIITSLG